jgi:hypothetical protein
MGYRYGGNRGKDNPLTGKTRDEIKALSERRKRAFLEMFSTTANIAISAKTAGVDRVSVRRWLENDTQFELEFNLAREDAIESMEEEARRRAVEGVVDEKPIYYKGVLVGEHVVTEYSDSLLMFLLKAARPDKYKDRVDVTGTTIIKAYAGLDVDKV